jgi:ectoine hydroxylase-related dioxygenase (phytanoyl-CoA dioxygenase family)
MQSMLFIKSEGKPGQAWHQDEAHIPTRDRSLTAIWIALDDATVQNGCLWYLPGTQRSGRFERTELGPNFGGLFVHYPEWLELEPVAAPCAAGGAVFHNGLVAHAAGANMTPRPRRAMTCAYMPDGSTFNGVQNVLPDGYFSSLAVGDVLDNDVINPLVWRAGVTAAS